MSGIPRQSGSEDEARANRRWLIGVLISIVFGLFGVVMALLGYMERTPPSATPATHRAPASHDEAKDAPRRSRKERGRD